MEIEFHPDQWLQVIHDYPVLMVLFGGLVGGNGATQIVKMTYLAWFKVEAVDIKRYRVSVMWLAILSTFFVTNNLWEHMIGNTHTGLRHVGAVVVALASPWVYRAAKAMVAWKFPEFAAKWGDPEEEGK